MRERLYRCHKCDLTYTRSLSADGKSHQCPGCKRYGERLHGIRPDKELLQRCEARKSTRQEQWAKYLNDVGKDHLAVHQELARMAEEHDEGSVPRICLSCALGSLPGRCRSIVWRNVGVDEMDAAAQPNGTMLVPVPDNPTHLFTFLHECGHLVLHLHETQRYWRTNVPQHQMEWEAEMYALRVMVEADIPPPPAQLGRARQYVWSKISIAMKMGAGKIHPHALVFATHDKPHLLTPQVLQAARNWAGDTNQRKDGT